MSGCANGVWLDAGKACGRVTVPGASWGLGVAIILVEAWKDDWWLRLTSWMRLAGNVRRLLQNFLDFDVHHVTDYICTPKPVKSSRRGLLGIDVTTF